jgi:hypothetical protein
MNADNDSETKAEIAFNKHRCEHFPIIIRKLNTLPLHVRQSAKFCMQFWRTSPRA